MLFDLQDSASDVTISSVMNFLRSELSLLSNPNCANLTKDFGDDVAALALDALLAVSDSAKFEPLDPLWTVENQGKSLATSDRWSDSKLTPFEQELEGKDVLNGTWFNRFFQLAVSFGHLGSGAGLLWLSQACRRWLAECKQRLVEQKALRVMEASDGFESRHKCASLVVLCDTTTTILGFFRCLLAMFSTEAGAGAAAGTTADSLVAKRTELSLLQAEPTFLCLVEESKGTWHGFRFVFAHTSVWFSSSGR